LLLKEISRTGLLLLDLRGLVVILLFESLFLLDQSLNTTMHILSQLDLAKAQTSLIGNIENGFFAHGVLTVDTSNLNVMISCDFIHSNLVLRLGQKWQFNMDGSSKTSTQVGGASGNIT